MSLGFLLSVPETLSVCLTLDPSLCPCCWEEGSGKGTRGRSPQLRCCGVFGPAPLDFPSLELCLCGEGLGLRVVVGSSYSIPRAAKDPSSHVREQVQWGGSKKPGSVCT